MVSQMYVWMDRRMNGYFKLEIVFFGSQMDGWMNG